MLMSFRDTLIETPRSDVWPNISEPHGSVKLTYKINYLDYINVLNIVTFSLIDYK